MLGWARKPNLRAAHAPRQVLHQGAKTRVRVLADIQNFALCAQCVCTACAPRAHCVHGIPSVGSNPLALVAWHQDTNTPLGGRGGKQGCA